MAPVKLPAPEIHYSTRRRTVGITIERDRRLVVHAPAGTSQEQIEAILHQKRHWIQAKLAHPQKYNEEASDRPLAPGSSVWYLGRQHVICTASTDQPQALSFDGHIFTLGAQLFPRAASLVQRWMRLQAHEFITPRVERYARSLGVQYQGIQVLDLKYRWGSCTPNANLLFNWRLIQAPASVIDYIIVHELAHLLVPDHSPAFWNVVAAQLPLFENAKDWLRFHGGLLEEV